MSENPVKPIYLGIGSNLGNKKRNIEKTKLHLLKNNIKILECSGFYESLSWPNPKNPKFLNIVVSVSTSLKPLELLEKCKNIEINLGRKKNYKNSPRVCDVDILDYKKLQTISKIFLPHPRMHNRNFVLLPLFEINKHWRHPVTNRHIKSLVLSLTNKDITSIKQF